MFAAWHPPARDLIVQFIVAFQTISDYLDNLCDRTDRLDETDFRTLHQSMLDAVSTEPLAPRSYYAYHAHSDDGGYLEALVAACRDALEQMGGYRRVQDRVKDLVLLYTDLQVYKHLPPKERVPRLKGWYARYQAKWPQLTWWEFAAAAGSTLGIFALVTEGARSEPVEDGQDLLEAYFPWICGLHILLDYLIDQEEDVRENDLNFVSFYASAGEMQHRLRWILAEALQEAARLADPAFHVSVIEGLLGLYLTDSKVKAQGLGGLADTLVIQAGWRARVVRACCRVWRAWRARPKGAEVDKC